MSFKKVACSYGCNGGTQPRTDWMEGEQKLGVGNNIQDQEGIQEKYAVKKDWVKEQLFNQYPDEQRKLMSGS